MNPDRVIILGGKGTAVNIAMQIEQAHRQHGYPMVVEGFGIDDPSLGNSIGGFPIVCGLRNAWQKYRHTRMLFLFAVYKLGVMEQRMQLLQGLGIPANRFANFIHPLAYRSPSVRLGYGNVVLSHACLQNDVRIGNNNIINSNVVVEHETTLHDCGFLAASACVGARVKVGSGVFVGLGATVREDTSLGDFAVIGMASTVLRDVAPRRLVYGSPASERS